MRAAASRPRSPELAEKLLSLHNPVAVWLARRVSASHSGGLAARANCDVGRALVRVTSLITLVSLVSQPRRHASRGGRPGGLPLRGSRA